jgi:hypothetical protein
VTELRFTWPEFAATGLAIASISYVTWFRYYREPRPTEATRQSAHPHKKNPEGDQPV